MPRRVLSCLALACGLAACRAEPTEQYGFLARLGRDTVSVERVSRYPHRLVSDEVDRFPDVRRRHTELDLNPDGSIRHMDMRVRIPSADPVSQDRRIVADFTLDSVRVRLTDGNGTHGIAMATEGRLTMPHVPQMYSLIELCLAAALDRTAADSIGPDGTVRTHQFYPDRELRNYPVPMHRGFIHPVSDSIVEIRHDWLAGTGVATLDRQHRMLAYDGARSTYKVLVQRLDELPDVEAIGERFEAAERAAGPVHSLSVRDTVRASIGTARFMVDYGRPLRRGRTLLGEVIPYNYVWRTGANAATQFSTSAPITLAGITLDPGTYTLWTLPRPDRVLLIVNRQTGQWGTGYGPAHDIGRAPLAIGESSPPVEQFTIGVDSTGPRSGELSLAWGPFRWTAPIEIR